MNPVPFAQKYRLSPLAAAAVLALLAPLGHAQTAGAAREAATAPNDDAQRAALTRVEITGSKIKGVDVESSVPIQTLTRTDIEARGANTLADILQELAIAGEARGRTAATGDQQSYVDLRGIGASRTLVLVNGHRWVGGSDIGGIVDLNSIPLGAVERIDVLKDGGSVLYGADAMTGLINIVLKERFDGAQLRAYFGNHQSGKGARKEAQFTIGHTTDRFAGLLAFELTQTGVVRNSDYELSSYPRPYGTGTYAYSDTTPTGRFQLCKGALLANGSCAASTLADPSGVKGNFFVPVAGATQNWRSYNHDTDSFNDNGYADLIVPLTQKSVMGTMTYEVTDHIKFKLVGQFMDATAKNDNGVSNTGPYALNLGPGGVSNGTGIFIAKDSYYNPYGVPVGRVQRLLVEGGEQKKIANAKTRAISPTLTGDFTAWGRSFDWEVGAEHGSTHHHSVRTHEISVSRLTKALGPSFKDANGNIVCGTPGNVVAGCVPLNLLGGAGTVTQAMLDYITLDPQDVSVWNNFYDHDYFAQISSPNLFKLPAGAVGFAGGFERHSASGDTSRGVAYDNVDVLSGTRGNTGGGYTATDMFGEFYVPLLKGLPFVQKLDLSIAGRRSKYDFGARVNNKKFGLKWKVTDDLALRGSFSTGYRLDLGGLIQNTQTSVITVTDPCSFTTSTAGVKTSDRYAALTAEQQAQCRAAGVPAGGYDTRTAPQTTQLSTGNSQLGPERDIFRTIGLVYSPSFVPGLDMTIDYWDVIFRDSVLKATAATLVPNCLANPADARFCPDGWLKRDATGAVTFVRNSSYNGPGGERYTGFDLNFRYQPKATSLGKFTFESTNAIMTDFIDVTTTPVLDNVGIFANAKTRYHVRSNFSVNWSREAWGARWSARYYSNMLENCTFVGTPGVTACNALGPVQSQTDPNNPATAKYLPFRSGGSANRIGGYVLHDLSAFYKPTEKSRIKVGVNNLFDKQPPQSVSTSRNFVASFGVPDRYFYAEYLQNF